MTQARETRSLLSRFRQRREIPNSGASSSSTKGDSSGQNQRSNVPIHPASPSPTVDAPSSEAGKGQRFGIDAVCLASTAIVAIDVERMTVPHAADSRPFLPRAALQHTLNHDSDVSRDLWTAAYRKLRTGSDTALLIQVYEKILTNHYAQRSGSDILPLGDDAPNMFGEDDRQRVARMTEMTQLSLEKAKQHENVHQAVKQAIGFVKATATVVSSMLTAYPPASIAWSGICAVLPILAIPSTQSLALRDGLMYVMEKMEWYMAISMQSLTWTTRPGAGVLSLVALVKDRITTLFQTLIEFEARAVCFLHGKSPLTRTITSIWAARWDSDLQDIRGREAEISGYMSQFTSTTATSALGQISQDTSKLSELLREMKNIREHGAEESQHQTEIQILEYVARFSTETTCPYLERMMAIPRRVEGTCEWFQTHTKYREWLAAPVGSVLVVSADPGCGKSVLSRFLVEEGLPPELPHDATICYFFFKDSPDQNNVAAALCALIHQVLTKRPALTDRVRPDIIQNGAALTIKERVLWKIFEKVISEPAEHDVVCVLDAFDECGKEGRLSLVEHIQALLTKKSSVKTRQGEGRLRFLITTRGYPEVMRLFKQRSLGFIHLAGENKDEIDQIQKEIELVARHRLDRLAVERGFSDKHKESLRQSFLQKGGQQRTYLWVRLVFEVLESNLRDQLRVWKVIIDTLPQTVYDAYDKLLERVLDAEKDRVMMLLRLMLAAFRPLPLQTAILLLNAREFFDEEVMGEAPVAEEGEAEWESETSFRSWVLQTCGIFVTVYDQHLFFLHQTAKEFLQDSGRYHAAARIPKEGHSFRHSISATEAHRMMAEACIALWKYGDRPTAKWEKDERYRYPLELWAQHFREAQVFVVENGSTKLTSDVDARFWETYLALWQDPTFIRGQQLSQFLARLDPSTYDAPVFTDEVKLAFIASYGHYRLLKVELDRVSSIGAASVLPSLLSAEGIAEECAGLLLGHLPTRPVVVVSECV